jgi:hypothetical protein
MRKNYGFSQNIAVFSFIILSLGLSLFVTLEGIAFAQFAGNDLFGEINKMLQTVNHALSTNPPSVDVTGTYSCNDGATYYVRQVPPGLVFWVGISSDNGRSFTNVFSGAIQGTTITGNWADVPLGKYHNAGTLTLKADSIPVSLHKISGTGPFGGSSWNRLPPNPNRLVTKSN